MAERKMDKKELKERQISYDSLPPGIRDSLTEEEKAAFLNQTLWPESLFEKLDEFILKH